MDLLAIGGVTLDHLYRVDRLPKRHFEATIEEYGLYFGGRAPNVAAVASRLGLKAGVVSPVGEDFTSSGYESHLESLGVDLRGLVKIGGQKTKRIFIFTDPKGDQITFFYYGAESHFNRMRIPFDLMCESRIVHITSSGSYDFNLKCAKQAHDRNIIVSFDPGNDPFTEIREYLVGMVQSTTFLFMNDVEAHDIIRRLGVAEASEILELGPEAVVIMSKRGKSSVIYTRGNKEPIPSAAREIRDPTGASDAYVGAFLTTYIKGHDLRTAGMLGSIEAAFVVESLGSQTNLPTWNSLCMRYQKVFKQGVNV